MATELAFRSLTELGGGLRRKEFSSRELVDHYLARIDRANKKLHAYVEVYAESARAAAEAADKQRLAGMPIGPLHGLPIAVKDLCDIEGRIGTVGSKAWASRRGTTTATVVERLLSAGMIILGKTHMVEFAFGGWGTNPLMGTPWNPWDLATHRVPGGSSSGSGVAVAAGLAPAAIGSDTGGSVRIPAAFNGITGLKTTFGWISLHGCFPLSTTLDSIGPLTRTTEDSARVFAALAGFDAKDPITHHLPVLELPAFDAPKVKGLRIAMLPESQFPSGVDAAVRTAWREAGEVFRKLGAIVEERRVPFDIDELAARNGRLIASEGYAIHRDYIEDEKVAIGQFVRARMMAGRGVSAADYIAVREHQRKTAAQFTAWMEDADALLAPACPVPAIPVANVDEKTTPATLTRSGNYIGACGLSLPAGFSPDGLPVGIQLLGRPFNEHVLLRMGAAYEQATDWHRRTPKLDALMG
ncbi:MAG: amidase [Burkholderiales bacterium]